MMPSCDLRSDFDVKLTLKALRRILGDTANAKDELYPRELLKIRDQVNMDVPHELSIWTGILFFYRSLLRKGHVFSEEFDTNLIKRSELEFTDYGLLITVNRSKTIQYAERSFLIPIRHVGGPLCIVRLMREYFLQFPASSESQLPSRICDGKLTLPSYGRALMCTKRWGTQAELSKDLDRDALITSGCCYYDVDGRPCIRGHKRQRRLAQHCCVTLSCLSSFENN